jgi:GNAT superfamily N-acetyltransferase
MFSIRRVDGLQDSQAALLKWLQLDILPADDPLPTHTGWWWVLYCDNQPVGFCSLRKSSKWSDTGYLSRAGVMVKYRGKGLQKRLINVRIRLAKQLKLNWLISDTYHNPASANSLIRCGFQMYIPTRQYGAEGTCYWRKKL